MGSTTLMLTAAGFVVVVSLAYSVWFWTTAGRGGAEEGRERGRRDEPPLGKH